MAAPPTSRDLTQRLAAELVTGILDRLEPTAIVAVSQTCRRLRAVAAAHDRFWHTCAMEAGIDAPKALRKKTARFSKRVRALVALGVPIGIAMHFWFDPETSDEFACGDGIHEGLDSWRKPIRLVLSAKIAPLIVSFDLSVGNSYGDYAYSDLATPKSPALRNLRLSFYTDFATSERSDEEDRFSLIPAALFHGGVPQLRSVTLDNICFGADKRAVGKIFAFANVTTANLPNLDLHYMHNLGLYLPNVVCLTVGPTLAHDRIDIREILRMDRDKTNATSPLDYLRDKIIIPFGTSLKSLHICFSDFEREFSPRGDLNHYIRILAQVIRGLAPHLRVLSFDDLDDTVEGVASADFIDELAGACSPGSTTSFAINVANDVRLNAQGNIRGLDLTIDAIRDGISIMRLNIALYCSTSCKGKDDDHCFWPKLFAALQQRSQNVNLAMPRALLAAQNGGLARVLDNLRCSLPSAAFKFIGTDAEPNSVRPVSSELA